MGSKRGAELLIRTNVTGDVYFNFEVQLSLGNASGEPTYQCPPRSMWPRDSEVHDSGVSSLFLPCPDPSVQQVMVFLGPGNGPWHFRALRWQLWYRAYYIMGTYLPADTKNEILLNPAAHKEFE